MIASGGQFDELGRLCAALCDGELSAEESSRLEQLVTQSPAARRYFFQYTQLNGELFWEHSAAGAREALPQREKGVRTILKTVLTPFSRPWVLAAALALIAVTLGTIPVYRHWLAGRNSLPTETCVARITRTIGAQWAAASAGAGDVSLAPSAQLDLRAGLAEVSFETGARVILQGPAVLDVESSSRGSLRCGSLTVNVPRRAIGFTIQTPTASVVDLGTQFGLLVDRSGVAEVHVFSGSVEIHPPTGPAAPGYAVREGQAVRLSSIGAGAMPRIDSIALGGRTFVRSLPPQRGPALPGGSVGRLRAMVAADPRLIHHYPFEGATAAEKCRDRRGDLDLGEVVMAGGRGEGRLDYSAGGIDPTTNAICIQRDPHAGNLRGVSLQSHGTLHAPAAMTVELLLNFAGGRPGDEGVIAVAVGTRENEQRCGFFVAAVDRGQLVHLLDGGAPWTESQLEFMPGDWYYVASTFRAVQDSTLINTYVANLTRGERTLAHVVQHQMVPGVLAASRLGIGKGFNDGVAHAYPWSGALDEVAIYGSALDKKTLDEHLNALIKER